MISRREFLGTTAVLLAPTGGIAAEEPSNAIVDTHTHFYDPERPEGVPWPPKRDELLYRRVLPADYAVIAKPHAIVGTVVVEASPLVEDNQWLLDLAAREPFILAVVGNLDPLAPEFATQLERFCRNPRFRGIRTSGKQLIEHGHEPAYVDAMKRLADTGRSLDLNGDRNYVAHVAPLAHAVPQLRIILDHVGSAGDSQALAPAWLDALRAAGTCPNVYCKVSGLPEQAKAVDGARPTDPEYYRPILDAVWEVFGADRLIFGSNWPVSDKGVPFPEVVKISQTYFAGKGVEAVAKIFRKNAESFYRWPVAQR